MIKAYQRKRPTDRLLRRRSLTAGLLAVGSSSFDENKWMFNCGYGRYIGVQLCHSGRADSFFLIFTYFAPVVTTIIPSILIRKAIIGSSDNGANPTARLKAAISSGIAGLAVSVAPSAQIGVPSDVSAVRSVRRSASRLISCASAGPVASKTSIALPFTSRVKS
jgi:hypothetical protein